VKVLPVGALNVYDVLKHATLVVTRDALEQLVVRLGDAEGAA
jgi:ribosomal protein L4